jgi:hypothetical protein
MSKLGKWKRSPEYCRLRDSGYSHAAAVNALRAARPTVVRDTTEQALDDAHKPLPDGKQGAW